jgi:hypothetical protein
MGGMNAPFWFLLALGVIGLLRVPKSERSGARFRVGVAAVCLALAAAAILELT